MVKPRERFREKLSKENFSLKPELPTHEYLDSYGNFVWRFMAPIGALRIRYDATLDVSPLPDPILTELVKTPVEDLPNEVLVYTLPSRYCQSDLFIDDAYRMFGDIEGGWKQVQAVCDWLHQNITYGNGSTSTTSAYEAYQQSRGVCRDFAHLGVSFCRALNFPARYVCGYLPDINVEPDPAPMDFHAWFEVFLEGKWRTFDARHNRPRTGRVVIAHGRDAVDVAFSTAYGSAKLMNLVVWADEVK